jgi:hypothetical protein
MILLVVFVQEISQSVVYLVQGRTDLRETMVVDVNGVILSYD